MLAFVILSGISNAITGGSNSPEKQAAKQAEQAQPAAAQPAADAPKAEAVKPVLNVKEILGKSEEEVKKLLGEPSSREEQNFRLSGTETRVPAVSAVYQDGALDIMFIDGKPVRISYTPKEPGAYPDDIEKTFASIGFEGAKVGDRTDLAALVTVDGLFSAKVFNNGGKVEYAYLITEEKYK